MCVSAGRDAHASSDVNAFGRSKGEGGEWRGPLHGVPIAVKDLCAMRDVPTACGTIVLADWRPDHDACVVERLAAAGAVILGKLQMTEGASILATATLVR